jgi:hypothetical protein
VQFNNLNNHNHLKYFQYSISAVIFSKRKISDRPIFTLNGEILNVVDDFAYLGIIFMSNGSFSKIGVRLYGE